MMQLDDLSSALRLVQRQYLQLVDLRRFQLPESDILRNAAFQKEVVAIFQPSDRIPSPPARYTHQVLKLIVDQILAGSFEEDTEVDDDLMELFSAGFALRGPQNPHEKVPVTYVPNLPNKNTVPGPYAVTLVENPSLISGHGTTGLRTWEAALALSEFILQSHETVLDGVKTVLELGAGTGLCALICAKLGVPRVYATDGDENVVASLKVNAEANSVEDRVTSSVLWWGAEDVTLRQDVDLLIGADVTYDPDSIPYLVEEIRRCRIRNPVMKTIISATVRNEDTFEAFRRESSKVGFRVRETQWKSPDPSIFHYFPQTDILILEIDSISECGQ